MAHQNLANLICANTNTASTNNIDAILAHLKLSLIKVIREIKKLPNQSDEHLMLYGPYLGRSLIELSTTSLITRLDPLRVLIVKGNQSNTDYDVTKPQKASIRWQGDVMAEIAPADLWSDKSLANPTRAILGAYSIELVLRESAEALLDSASEELLGEWYNELVRTDVEGLIARVKTQLNQLYSTLSKGIHHELVMPLASALDRDSVLASLNNTLFYISTLGLIVSSVPHVYAKQKQATIFNYYKQSKSLEVI